MRVVGVNMRVNLGQHGSIAVPHQGSDGQVVVALDKFAGGESMPGIVSAQLAVDLLGDAVHAVADGEFRPCMPSAVLEDFTFRVRRYQALYNMKRRLIKMYDTRPALALGFFFRENNALPVMADMPHLDMPGLLRPAAGMPHEGNQQAERIIGTEALHDAAKIDRRHVRFPALGRGLFQFLDRARLEVAKFFSPVIDTLYGNDSAATVIITPGAPVRVNPFNEMEGLHGRCFHICTVAKIGYKALKVIFIPFETAWRAMAPAPKKVFLEKRVNRYDIFHVIECRKTAYAGP